MPKKIPGCYVLKCETKQENKITDIPYIPPNQNTGVFYVCLFHSLNISIHKCSILYLKHFSNMFTFLLA